MVQHRTGVVSRSAPITPRQAELADEMIKILCEMLKESGLKMGDISTELGIWQSGFSAMLTLHTAKYTRHMPLHIFLHLADILGYEVELIKKREK